MSQCDAAPLFWLNGRPFWGFSGAEETSQGGTTDQGTAGQETGQTDPTGASGGGASGGGSQSGETVSKAEFDALKERMAAADRTAASKATELADAQAKLKTFEDANKSELEKAQAQATEAQKASDEAHTSLEALRIENAFLTENSQTWHDPGAALKLLDRSDIKVTDAGKVEGMKAAIEKLAKASPWLVKSADGGTSGGASGANGGSGQGGSGKHTIPDRERRFPQRLGGSR